MPRRRRHVVDGESPNTRRRRLRSISNNRQEETRRNTVSFQVSTPEDSPASRRLRTRRHENRRSRGLPSDTPPTPIVVDRNSNVRTSPSSGTTRESINCNSVDLRNSSILPLRRVPARTVRTGVSPRARRMLPLGRYRTVVPRLTSLNDCLKKLGGGEDVEYVDMSDHPSGDVCRNDFLNRCDTYYLRCCDKCKEASLVSCSGDHVQNVTCKRCRSDYRLNSLYLYGKENDMDPFKSGYVLHLPVLSMIEELFIAKVFVVMQMYRISGSGGIGYKGHCLNVQKDLEQPSSWCRVLPWLPRELPVVVIKFQRDNLPTGTRLFKVNIVNIRIWLEFLKTNHPAYSDIRIDLQRFDQLSQLSDNSGNVDIISQLSQVVEDNVSANTYLDNSTSNDNNVNNDDISNYIEHEIENGPEQGGATSMVLDENSDILQEGHVYLPADQLFKESEEGLITRIVTDRLGTNENAYLFNVDGHNLNDYSTPGIQSMAFPTLFPYGEGDVTKRSRLYDVTFTNAMKHYLNYSIYSSQKKRLLFPYAMHKRWVHWAQNTAERHRFNGQRQVFIRRNEGVSNLTIENLRNIVQNNGEEFNAIIRKMHVYNANIVGSNSYFYKKRKELESLIEAKGMPTCWFTLSAADNHWNDLHKLIYDDDVPVFDTMYKDMNEKQKLSFRVRIVHEFPHIVDEYFHSRVESFLKSFFLNSDSITTNYYWFRVEYQERGTAHIHGCMRLLTDFGISESAQKVRDGRIAIRKLQLAGLRPRSVIPRSSVCDDKFVSRFDLNGSGFAIVDSYSTEQLNEMNDLIDESLIAEQRICAYNDFLFSTSNLDPPSDSMDGVRVPLTKFIQTSSNSHPSCVPVSDSVNYDDEAKKLHYCQLVNSVQRHWCSAYCGGNTEDSECRFGFPLKLQEQTHISVVEYIGNVRKKLSNGTVRERSVLRYRIELMTKRNDRWLNSHNRKFLESWMANMDFRLVVDIGKVMEYLTKYVTKAEKSLTRGMEYLVRSIMRANMLEGSDTLTTLRKIMGKLLGSRMISKQETCHLLNSLPLVSCSHSFLMINLKKISNLLDLSTLPANESELVTGRLSRTSVTGNEVSIVSIIEAYGKRHLESSYHVNTLNLLTISEIELMSFDEFVRLFYVGQKQSFKNLIIPHVKKNYVPVYYPSVTCDPLSPNFFEYCKYFLVKYRPWKLDVSNAWNNLTDNNDIVVYWENFVTYLKENDLTVPDHVRRQMDIYTAVEHLMPHNVDAVTNNTVADDDVNNSNANTQVEDFDIQLELNHMHANADNSGESHLDDDDVRIVWNDSHNWYESCNEYELNADEYITTFKDYCSNSTANVTVNNNREISLDSLRSNQIVAHGIFVNNVVSDTYEGGLMCMYGMGGCGKSYVIDAIRTTLRNSHNKEVIVTSTTGLTANALRGTTIHSALNLPIGRRRLTPLRGESLRNLQDKFRNINGLIIDEFSMLRSKELSFINDRLKQIKCNNNDFGGVCVLLAGDPGQLPPVAGTAVWDDVNKVRGDDNKNGCLLFQNVKDVVHLDDNMRLDVSDPDAVYFDAFLRRLRNGNVTLEDYNFVSSNCCRHHMGDIEYTSRGFNANDVTKVHCTNNACNNDNLRSLLSLRNPVLKINAINTGEAINSNSSDLMGLYNLLYLCVGSEVMLTTNVCQQLGLSNGVVGTVVDIVFDRNDSSNVPGFLPKLVWVELAEGQYVGPSLFPGISERRNWVPIIPITANQSVFKSGERVPSSRTMIPLKLCYAFTPWKIQGQTIDKKLVATLGRLERSNGLTYVIFSRVRRFKDIAIDGGLCFTRLATRIGSATSFKYRVQMEKELLEVKHSDTVLKFYSIYRYVPNGVVSPDSLNNNNINNI